MVNLDVFTHVITWFITLVADHEDVKRELRDEVTANKDNLLDYLAKTETHLHRCFYESMRVRPFTSESFPVVNHSPPDPGAMNEPCKLTVRLQFSPLANAHPPSRILTVFWSNPM